MAAEQDLKDSLMDKHLQGWHEDMLRNASIEYFFKTGKATGSFRQAIMAMMEEYANTREALKPKGRYYEERPSTKESHLYPKTPEPKLHHGGAPGDYVPRKS